MARTKTRKRDLTKAVAPHEVDPVQSAPRSSTLAPSSVEAIDPGENGKRATGALRKADGTGEPEMPEEQLSPQEVGSDPGTILQHWMGNPSFRQRVIARLIKKLG